MTRRLRIGTFTSALLVSLAPSAFAQIPPFGYLPPGLARIAPYMGILTADANLAPIVPNTWTSPNYVFDYQVPRVVYVPVAVPTRTPQPAVQPVRVASVPMRRGTVLTDVQVTPGMVVTWSNGDNQPYNLVLAQSTSSGTGQRDTASQTWQIRARDSFSLEFNQPGTYEYYRLEDPTRRARIIVTG